MAKILKDKFNTKRQKQDIKKLHYFLKFLRQAAGFHLLSVHRQVALLWETTLRLSLLGHWWTCIVWLRSFIGLCIFWWITCWFGWFYCGRRYILIRRGFVCFCSIAFIGFYCVTARLVIAVWLFTLVGRSSLFTFLIIGLSTFICFFFISIFCIISPESGGPD